MKQIHGALVPSGFMTVVSSHVRKTVRVIVVNGTQNERWSAAMGRVGGSTARVMLRRVSVTLLQTRDTVSARARTAAGSRGARAAQSGTGSLLRDPLAGCVDVRVLEEGWECLFCEAEALRRGPVTLDAGKGAETTRSLRPNAPSYTALYKAQLARHRQHHRQLLTARRQRVLLPRSRCPPALQRVLRLWPS